MKTLPVLSALLIIVVVVSLVPGLARGSAAADPLPPPQPPGPVESLRKQTGASIASTQGVQFMPGREVVLRLDNRYNPYHVPAPQPITALGVRSVSFNVNYNPASCTGSISAWSQAAKDAFSYAVGIWASQLNASTTIVIDACWRSDLGSGILGSAGPTSFYKNTTTDTWYPVALANALANSDLNGPTAEIKANFSSTFDWYFGTDGNPGAKIDFASVVLHELGHGLGFLGSMWVDVAGYPQYCGGLGRGCWGLEANPPYYPVIYDRFTENGSGQSLLNESSFPNPSAALGTQLTSDNVYFNGANARAANGGSHVKLYAPSPWEPGSSYAHLDTIFDNTPNALMTYSLARGEAIHDPGPITCGIFRDLGWQNPCQTTSPPPTVTSITPNSGNNTGTVHITNLAGSNFQTGATVKLTRSGQSDINATNVVVVSASQITCDFNLTGAAAGQWNVVVTNPDSQSGTLPDGFTVNTSSTAPIVTSITPNTGVNTGTVHITNLAGSNFSSGATVKLTRSSGISSTVTNGDFESGATGWTEYSSHGWPVIVNSGFPAGTTPHSGSWAVWLGGDYSDTSYIQQQVTVPAGSPYLAYWHWIASGDSCGYDFANVLINSTTVRSYTLCSSVNTGGWVKHVVNLSAYVGQSVSLQIRVTTDGSLNSNLFVDDVSFQASGLSALAPQAVITATNVVRVSASQITCDFNLTGAAVGQWNVVVTNPDAQSGTLPDGFTVNTSSTAPVVTSITPNTGVNTGTVHITNLAGSNFQIGATVKLTKPGQTPITGTNVMINATLITCDFDLTGAATGQWNVVVTNPDLQSGTLVNGFALATSGGGTLYLPVIMNRWPPIPDAPVLNAISNSDGDGNYSVTWNAAYLADTYTLQEDDNAAFSSPVTVYDHGDGTSWTASGKASGTYYYRVKATNSWGDSGWSNVQSAIVSPPQSVVYVQNNTGGQLCYEVYSTGIGQKCYSPGTYYYGTFPIGTYSWHASAPCGSASGSRYYGLGTVYHQFWCGTGVTLQSIVLLLQLDK